MEAERHGLLKSGSIIFKPKWHDSICKRALGGCEEMEGLVELEIM